ncbi:MAG: exo-alpha-sialidase [Gemmatimonadetes bacterium]|nr:exo-alpha-sialidase [Gemmatimonadota bacterium]
MSARPRLFVATRKGVFTVERRKGRPGARWAITRAQFLGDNASMVLPDRREGWVYLALGHGHFGVKMHRSPNGGRTWEPCATPTYPPKPEGVDDREPNSGRPIPWNTELVWALETGHDSEPETLWCGTLPGGLFRSRDRGGSWSLIEPLWNHPRRREWMGGGAELPGVHSICVDPRDARHVRVAVSCGGVWETRDAGASWENRTQGMRAAYMPPDRQYDPYVQDPHQMVQCRAAPDVLWVQHHNGVFHSTDGAASWHEITTVKPAVFGFAVAVHPDDPDTAWFVPGVSDEHRIPVKGGVVVARTRNGGKSFQVLKQGLPQGHSYDLTYRHALDVDQTGDLLAFGTTTGALWVSENQGDSWVAVSEHLPPVYCVRFG